MSDDLLNSLKGIGIETVAKAQSMLGRNVYYFDKSNNEILTLIIKQFILEEKCVYFVACKKIYPGEEYYLNVLDYGIIWDLNYFSLSKVKNKRVYSYGGSLF